MKKAFLLFKLHSFIDIITNSSTELFITKTNKDVEAVKAILHKFLEEYNKENNINYDFESIFGTIAKFSFQDYVNYLKNAYPDTDEAEKLLEKINNDNNDIYSTIVDWTWSAIDEFIEYQRKEFIYYGAFDYHSYDKLDNSLNTLLKEKVKNLEQQLQQQQQSQQLTKKMINKITNEIYQGVESGKIKKPSWWDKIISHVDTSYHLEITKELDQSIVIIGAEENSIPYEIFEKIEETFNAIRIHMG